MLHSLTIDNYALIDHLEFRPEGGLNVITGETGAGKSIIMGALGLILGQRADAKTVRNGAGKCIIEAQFEIAGYHLEEFFHENELDFDAASTIIRREILATGKSRAFVNDTPVQLNILKTLGDKLIDIHSQHQNLLLGNTSFQQEVIDTLAGNQKERDDYQRAYKHLCMLRKQLAELKARAEQDTQEADYILFQLKQLNDANLQEGEQEALEEEQELLSHAEEIKEALSGISEGLDGDTNGILPTLKHIQQQARNLTRIYPSLSELADRIESDFIDLSDIASDIAGQTDSVNFDPQRFEFVEERLSTLYNLQKKFSKDSVEELIAVRNILQERAQFFDNSDEEISELEARVNEAVETTKAAAMSLTASRLKAAKDFQQQLIQKVSYLGMPNVRFEVQISQLKDFSANGSDEVTFLFSANKNQPLKPCSEVASGGEISRLMLSIKALIANASTLPTIIFDEIDTGVSGDIADRMGEVMKQMSSNLQVITITHLPQVAGKGNAHFLVYKRDSANDTQTHINRLEGEDRLQEIARMLSGSKITAEALANARTLLC